MTVIVLTDCPPSLRGDLTKWLQEVNTNVFVGHLNKEYATNCGNGYLKMLNLAGNNGISCQ